MPSDNSVRSCSSCHRVVSTGAKELSCLTGHVIFLQARNVGCNGNVFASGA